MLLEINEGLKYMPPSYVHVVIKLGTIIEKYFEQVRKQ